MKCQLTVLVLATSAAAAFGDGFLRMSDATSGFNGLDPRGGAFAANTDTPAGGPQGFIGRFGGPGGGPTSFLTFCIERNEVLNIGARSDDLGANNRFYGRISDSAMTRGQQPDPISEETAILYSTFRSGNAIAGYLVDGTTAYAGLDAKGITSALQFTLWKLENEVTDFESLSANYRPVAAAMEAWAISNATVGNFHGVRALSLYAYGGVGSRTDPASYTTGRQDQLTLIPLPSAGGLAGLGLVALSARSRRRAF